jgi:hypothetical protein
MTRNIRDVLRAAAPEPARPAPSASALGAAARRRTWMRRTVGGAAACAVLAAAGVVALVQEDPGGVDAATEASPRPLWVQPSVPPAAIPDQVGLLALVEGTVAYDATADCYLLVHTDPSGAEIAMPVVWPAETVPLVPGPGVVLRDGTAVTPGQRISGGGSFPTRSQLGIAFEIPDECFPDGSTVAMFNPYGAVDVT